PVRPPRRRGLHQAGRPAAVRALPHPPEGLKVHFLTLSDLPPAAHRRLFDRAAELKARRRRGERDATLAGRTLVLIFEKASTRTRLSFEAAIGQLGGQAITLSTSDSQLSRGETWSDTAKVVSGYADAVMIRTFADERLR